MVRNRKPVQEFTGEWQERKVALNRWEKGREERTKLQKMWQALCYGQWFCRKE